jgi:3-oxoacyl-[acyl-carrier protein] reductase
MQSVRVALITGGSRGFGAEVARAFGRAGYAVAVNYLGRGTEAEAVAKSIGGDAVAFKADVGSPADVEMMARAINDRWGRLDVLVNNAGIVRDALFVRYAEADWDEIMRVNLKGCFNAVRACVPLMEGRGHIVNISSRTALVGKPGQAAYSASKAALMGFTRSLAKELGKMGIRVNALMPGYLPTDMGRSAGAAMERAQEESMLGSLSDPDEAASFVLWLAGTENITGQVFVLDSR